MRYDRYEPRAQGAKAMMTHVDEFRPVHNLDSLEKLAEALSTDSRLPQRDLAKWKALAA